MREILFRGKQKENGEWIYGGIYSNNDEYFIINDSLPVNELGSVCNGVPINPETVGQYTGLKDKNGTMIFEGDIVGFDEFPGSHHRIYFDVDNARWTDERIEDGDTCTDYYGFDFVRDSTVIGNIHDNPELIKL